MYEHWSTVRGSGRYRETGWMDDLGTVGTLHQGERCVSGLLLIGLFADFAHCGQRKSRLEGTDGQSPH